MGKKVDEKKDFPEARVLTPPGRQGVVLSTPGSKRKPPYKSQLQWIPCLEAWSSPCCLPFP